MATITKSVRCQGETFSVHYETSGWSVGIVRVLNAENVCVLKGYVNERDKLKWNERSEALMYDFVKKIKRKVKQFNFRRNEKSKLQSKTNKG